MNLIVLNMFSNNMKLGRNSSTIKRHYLNEIVINQPEILFM